MTAAGGLGRCSRLEKINQMPESNEKYFEYFRRIHYLKNMSQQYPHLREKYTHEVNVIIEILQNALPNSWAIGVNYALDAERIRKDRE